MLEPPRIGNGTGDGKPLAASRCRNWWSHTTCPEGLCTAAQNGRAFVGDHMPCVSARAECHGPHVRAPDQVQNRLWHGLHSPIPQPITETIRSAALAR